MGAEGERCGREGERYGREGVWRVRDGEERCAVRRGGCGEGEGRMQVREHDRRMSGRV